MKINKYPYHADVVGSFLRPATLKAAYQQAKDQSLTAEQFQTLQQQAVKQLVAQQRQHHLAVLNDGEFNRENFFLDFLAGLTGIAVVPQGFQLNFSGQQLVDDGLQLAGKIQYNAQHPFFADYLYLNSLLRDNEQAKVTIPAPTPLLFTGNFAVINNVEQFYATRKAYLHDILITYQRTIQHFYDLGLRYLQLDDPWLLGITLPFAGLQEQPEAAQKLTQEIVQLLQDLLASLPADLVVTTHICRGNFHSAPLGGGTYQDIVDILTQLPYDAFFLEYDDQQADGDFAPLAQIHQEQPQAVFVLGLITTKTGQIETAAELVAQIQTAAHFVPLNNLALSPQCGFASTKEGNDLTVEQQWAKIDLMNQVANQVWSK